MKNLCLTTALILLTAPVFAQDANDLAKQYVNMPEVQNMITEMFSPTMLADQMAATLPPGVTITDDQKQRIGTVMSEAMNDLRPRMEELMISGSAETFNTDELQALIDFYGSEHGAAIMTKMTPFMTNVMGKLGPEMQTLQAKITPQIIEIMQEQN
ncbi:MAG: DUF2059 domain-containing protein [Sulfitobacter sp.]